MEKEIRELQVGVEKIKARNRRVEADKAWETSKSRSLFILCSTYVVVVLFLIIIHESQPYAKAIVPALGYLLSSTSYDILKRWWLKRRRL